jgi:hypothetical protein
VARSLGDRRPGRFDFVVTLLLIPVTYVSAGGLLARLRAGRRQWQEGVESEPEDRPATA